MVGLSLAWYEVMRKAVATILVGSLFWLTGACTSDTGGGTGGSGGSSIGGRGGDSGGHGGTGTGGSGSGGLGGAAGTGGSVGHAGATGTGGTGAGGAAGAGAEGGAGGNSPLCGTAPCASNQVCVHPSCGGGVLVCERLPDGGQCAAGWTYHALCSLNSGGSGPGCEPPPCSPPTPFCADIPSACGGAPNCTCLPSNICQGGGQCGAIFNGGNVMCGFA